MYVIGVKKKKMYGTSLPKLTFVNMIDHIQGYSYPRHIRPSLLVPFPILRRSTRGSCQLVMSCR
jgi:hypothetical protein